MPGADAPGSTATPTSGGSGPPPLPARRDSLDVALPDEAPPSYASAIASGDLRVAAGPTRMDFSGPPPMPEQRPTPTGGSVLPGVGLGYERRDNYNNYAPPPPPMHPAHSGYPGAQQQWNQGGGAHALVRPINTGSPQSTQSTQSTQDADRTPTEAPTPGRPLLRAGQLLVYPRGYSCSKCGNTGYKGADPSHPCTSDWRKYGKPFNSALAHSYSLAPRPGTNGTTTEATNFQRPLPNLRPAGGGYPPAHSPHSPHSPYSPHARPPHQYQQYRPPQIQYSHYGAPVPSGALYVQPGDPRIGGRVCNRCGGSGTEMSFGLFLFDETQCRTCRGLGRVF